MMKIEKGWCFYTADFSLKAAGKSDFGGVILIRDVENRRKWNALPDDILESDDSPRLHVTGKGETFEEAIINANLAASHAKPIAINQGEYDE